MKPSSRESRRAEIRRKYPLLPIACLALIVALWGCLSGKPDKKTRQKGASGRSDLVMVTGYCNCETCCGWKRSWFGLGSPVYAYGKMKGKPKKVGVTATGTVAHHGTIAADPRVYKFGTRLRVPGYGAGVVEDIGGAIKGRHIDLWFPSHSEARKWGVKYFRPEELSSGMAPCGGLL